MNKGKAEPVSSWCYPRQAGSIKMRQRVVWSLIFLVYGVCLVKAEVQEEQASKVIEREDYPGHQEELLWMKKTMTMWEGWCLKQKKERKTASERTQELLKKTVREGTPVPKKETARVRTQGPWKNTVKVGTSVLAI